MAADDRNSRLRFCNNNFTYKSLFTVSSEHSLYPKSNLQTPQRFQQWSPTGIFEITSANNIIAVAGTQVVLTDGIYTGTALAAHMAAEMNSQAPAPSTVPANLGLGTGYGYNYDPDLTITGAPDTYISSYNATTYKFYFAVTLGILQLDISFTANAVWDMIGFIGNTDRASIVGMETDQIRIHGHERMDWDLSTPIQTTFFAAIARRNEDFPLSASAVVTLRADNVPMTVGVTAAFERVLEVTSDGVMAFLDDEPDTKYRHWQLIIQDRTNPAGPSALKIGVVYLGDYITLSKRGLKRGFSKKQIDPSLKNTAESGAVYYKLKNKYWTFSNLSTDFLKEADRLELEQLFEDVGNHTPLFISFDPTLCASQSLHELTKYSRFHGDPTLVQIKGDVYSMSFNTIEDL